MLSWPRDNLQEFPENDALSGVFTQNGLKKGRARRVEPGMGILKIKMFQFSFTLQFGLTLQSQLPLRSASPAAGGVEGGPLYKLHPRQWGDRHRGGLF